MEVLHTNVSNTNYYASTDSPTIQRFNTQLKSTILYFFLLISRTHLRRSIQHEVWINRSMSSCSFFCVSRQRKKDVCDDLRHKIKNEINIVDYLKAVINENSLDFHIRLNE